MALPFITPLIIAGATALLARQVYCSHKILDEAADKNTFAKLTMEVVEGDMNLARDAARESLLKLGLLRQETWAGPMARFLSCYGRMENLEPESAPLAGMSKVDLPSEEQISGIRRNSKRALERQNHTPTEEKEADNPYTTPLPGHSFQPPPHGMSFESVIDLNVTLCRPELARHRLADALESVEWAEKLYDELQASQEVKKTWQVQEAAEKYNTVIETLAAKLAGVLTNLEAAMAKDGVDCRQYSPENRQLALLAISFAKALLPLLENPIIDAFGNLIPGHEQAPVTARNLMSEVGNGVG